MKFQIGQTVQHRGKLVQITSVRQDYPQSSLQWGGKPKPKAKKEFLYKVWGSNREIREKYLKAK